MLDSYIEVDEDAGRTTLCALAQNPASPDCPIGFSAQVAFISYSRSASKAVIDSLVRLPFIYYIYLLYNLVPNGDYNVVSTLREIEKCGNMTCLDVTIYDDNVVENIESFEVLLIAAPGLDHSVSVGDSAEITIIDDDSEFQLFELYISLYILL